MKESESEVLKIEESGSELLCTDSTALVITGHVLYLLVCYYGISDNTVQCDIISSYCVFSLGMGYAVKAC
jgi:hypothetical protein